MTALRQPALRAESEAIGAAAAAALRIEIATYPKPGLVSPMDRGSHDDMDAAVMYASADALQPFFTALAAAGAAGAGMEGLRSIGVDAERAMMAATGGVNTHRGAIFGMGLLCAAAGLRQRYGIAASLGRIVSQRWGAGIECGPVPLHSHGTTVARRHAAGGARAEAASGFPSLYGIALPALADARAITPDAEAVRVHALMALIVGVADTNLLYRGGTAGLAFAQNEARTFLQAGGVAAPDWRLCATTMHQAFIAKGISPGGCADLLAMAMFVETRDA